MPSLAARHNRMPFVRGIQLELAWIDRRENDTMGGSICSDWCEISPA